MLEKKNEANTDMELHVEVWRKGQLVDEVTKELDLVVDAGLNAACGALFDSSGSRPAAFNYIAIGTSNTPPANNQTALVAEVARILATYAKDPVLGECSIDAEFNINNTWGIQECGIFNASSSGTMYCRDTFPVKNVEPGDILRIYYTGKFQRAT